MHPRCMICHIRMNSTRSYSQLIVVKTKSAYQIVSLAVKVAAIAILATKSARSKSGGLVVTSPAPPLACVVPPASEELSIVVSKH